MTPRYGSVAFATTNTKDLSASNSVLSCAWYRHDNTETENAANSTSYARCRRVAPSIWTELSMIHAPVIPKCTNVFRPSALVCITISPPTRATQTALTSRIVEFAAWFHRILSATSTLKRPIQPRTGEKMKRMKDKVHLKRHKQAGMYEEARLRSGGRCILMCGFKAAYMLHDWVGMVLDGKMLIYCHAHIKWPAFCSTLLCPRWSSKPPAAAKWQCRLSCRPPCRSVQCGLSGMC